MDFGFKIVVSLKDKYIKEVIPRMKERFGYRNNLAVPKIEKVVVNTGIGQAIKEEKIQEEISRDLALITGQKPACRPAKKAISAFKTRKGMIVGLMVTLRGQRMYDFLERLINIALPRSRDFRGLPEKSVDQNGNLTIGLKEQIIFPEISAEKARNIFGLEVTVVTTARSHEEGVVLLKLMGFPVK